MNYEDFIASKPLSSHHEFEGALIGHLLGDGCLIYAHKALSHRSGPSLRVRHKQDHVQLVKFMVDLFQPIIKGTSYIGITTNTTPTPSGNGHYASTISYWQSSSSHLLTKFEKDFYILNSNQSSRIKRIKIIPSGYLEKLTPLGLAIWYMDDGTFYNRRTYNSRSIKIFTNGFNVDEIATIIEYFKISLGIKTFRTREHPKGRLQYSLSISAYDIDKFLDIVRPYIELIPCMKYKLGD